MASSDMICKHKFVYGGIKYEVKDWGHRPVYYYDWFFCEKCLESKYNRLEGEGESFRIQFGATPKQS